MHSSSVWKINITAVLEKLLWTKVGVGKTKYRTFGPVTCSATQPWLLRLLHKKGQMSLSYETLWPLKFFCEGIDSLNQKNLCENFLNIHCVCEKYKKKIWLTKYVCSVDFKAGSWVHVLPRSQEIFLFTFFCIWLNVMYKRVLFIHMSKVVVIQTQNFRG